MRIRKHFPPSSSSFSSLPLSDPQLISRSSLLVVVQPQYPHVNNLHEEAKTRTNRDHHLTSDPHNHHQPPIHHHTATSQQTVIGTENPALVCARNNNNSTTTITQQRVERKEIIIKDERWKTEEEMKISNDIRKESISSSAGVDVQFPQSISSSSFQALDKWGEGDRIVPPKKRKGSFARSMGTTSKEMIKPKMKSKTNKKCLQQNGDHDVEGPREKKATHYKEGTTVVDTKNSTTSSSTKKSKRGSVIMEGSRCSRVNGRGWRCTQQALVGYSLCKHHLEAVPLVETTREKLSPRKIYRYGGLGELPASFLRFGPVYCDAGDDDSVKEEAWKHLLDKFPNGDQDRDQKTEDIYLDAFRRVVAEARASYADATLEGLSESQFQWMVIKDGCFFLQLVLFILGASKELGYPDDHMTFGTKQGRKVVHGWIKSMFHVGNQIPLLVLNEFMKEDFFQDVIVKHGKWERPTDLLSKRVLYDLLVLPAILHAHRASSSIQCEVPGNSNISEPEEQHSDLLHGLQNLVLGPKISRNDSIKDDDDEEEEEEEEGRDDLEAGATASTDHEVSNAGNDREELCVSALRRKGIYLWKSNGDGIRGIKFKNRMLFPRLYLPTVQLNQETELLFRNLKNYEMCQRQNEVRSFLGLMKKLISTQEDIKHLASKGILEVSKPQYGEKFIRMLQNLSETVTNHHHKHVLQQLRDYSSNFRCVKFKKGAMVVLILTMAQTVFGILSYAVSLRQSHA